MRGIIERHHTPISLHRFKDIQRGVFHGDAPPIFGEGHAHDVAGEQTADGFVADHHHVPALMSLRHIRQKGRDAFDQVALRFRPREAPVSRVRVPGAVDMRAVVRLISSKVLPSHAP